MSRYYQGRKVLLDHCCTPLNVTLSQQTHTCPWSSRHMWTLPSIPCLLPSMHQCLQQRVEWQQITGFQLWNIVKWSIEGQCWTVLVSLIGVVSLCSFDCLLYLYSFHFWVWKIDTNWFWIKKSGIKIHLCEFDFLFLFKNIFCWQKLILN